jgi:quercetin dioxygenase-like cupin family protein
VTIYKGLANKNIPLHYHPEDQCMYIIEGSMEGEIQGRHIQLLPGHEFFFPAKVQHLVKIGSLGCKYLITVKNGNHDSITVKN